MTTLTENSDNTDAISGDAATGEIIRITASDDAGGERLDRFLATAIAARNSEDGAPADSHSLSRSRIKALVLDGCLRENETIITDPSAGIKPSAVYQLAVPKPSDPTPQGEAIALDILFEDEHLIVINKPAGMVVHPAPGSPSGTLVNALIAHCGPSLTGIGGVMRPGIVHRLDKDTSGVMMAAKTDRAHQRLTDMFAAHDLDRRYHALVWGSGVDRQGSVDAPIGRAERDRKRQAVTAKGRKAITHWQMLRVYPPFGSLIECRLETGRTHQIRVHMAHIGHGVIGDPLYGKPARASQMPDNLSRTCLGQLRSFGRQALHAAHLGFAHPVTGEALAFSTDMPADMAHLHQLMEKAVAARASSSR
ncbi:MAG: RluA family pseudouridine synthase [Candidatus Puniceispirillaceae bacterium]|jgi:23S rRNA pseudouridine1911/1915/1917 synthase